MLHLRITVVLVYPSLLLCYLFPCIPFDERRFEFEKGFDRVDRETASGLSASQQHHAALARLDAAMATAVSTGSFQRIVRREGVLDLAFPARIERRQAVPSATGDAPGGGDDTTTAAEPTTTTTTTTEESTSTTTCVLPAQSRARPQSRPHQFVRPALFGHLCTQQHDHFQP